MQQESSKKAANKQQKYLASKMRWERPSGHLQVVWIMNGGVLVSFYFASFLFCLILRVAECVVQMASLLG